MENIERHPVSEPNLPPDDALQERRRLIADSLVVGVDPEAAVDLAERLGGAMGLPHAYRAVDRRIAVGHSLGEAESMLGSGMRSSLTLPGGSAPESTAS